MKYYNIFSVYKFLNIYIKTINYKKTYKVLYKKFNLKHKTNKD